MTPLDPVFGWSAQLFVAGVLAAAALHKLRDPVRFRETLRDYRLLGAPLVASAAALVVAAELVATGLLLHPSTRGWGVAIAATLLLLYSGAIAVNLARGRTAIDCGCSWGSGGGGISALLLYRNAALGLVLAVAGLPRSARDIGGLDAMVAVATATCGLIFYLAADRLIANRESMRLWRGAS